MRFKKGSKVEIFIRKDLPCCSWRIGELVSGNGHYYDVRYDFGAPLGVTAAPLVERVSRKDIRPSPPRVYTFRDWVPGDVVEVFEFDSLCWKAAIVSEVIGGTYYLVRLLGSFQELRAHKSLLRVRQIWIHEQWVLVGLVVGDSADAKSDPKSRHKVVGSGGKMKFPQEGDYFSLENTTTLEKSRLGYSRTMKRGSPNGLPYLKEHAGVQKMRDFGKEGKRQVTSSEYVGCFSGRSIEFSDTESSVGSCSISSHSPTRGSRHSLLNLYDSSDAESFCGWKYENRF